MTSVHNVQLIAGNTSCNWWTTYLAVTNNHSWLLRNLSTLYIIYFPIIRVARMILNYHVDNCICKFSRPRFAMLIYVLANDPLLIFFYKGPQWRHNKRDCVSNHRRVDCLLSSLFRRRSRKQQYSVSLAFIRGIHWWPVNSPHKGPVTRKMFPVDDVIMSSGDQVTALTPSRCLDMYYISMKIDQAITIVTYTCIMLQIYTLLAKKVVTPPLKTIKPMWIELLCFHLAEIGMIWTRDCSPTKSDTTLGRHSMQG